MPNLKPDQLERFAYLLIRQKRGDKKQEELKVDLQSLDNLTKIISEANKKLGHYYPFVAFASDRADVVESNLKEHRETINQLFLNHMKIEGANILFDQDAANKAWKAEEDKIRAEKKLVEAYNDNINHGLIKKAVLLLANEDPYLSERNYLLTDDDLVRALTALNLRDHVFVSPFNPESIQDHLKLRKKEFELNQVENYTFRLILQIHGNHWVRATMTVNTETLTVTVIYHDSLKTPGKKIEPVETRRKIQELLAEPIRKVYPQSDWELTIDCLGAEIQQPEGWECGYLALRSTVKDFPEEKESNSAQNVTQERADLCAWGAAPRSFHDLRNIVFRLILKVADIDPIDYSKFDRKPQQAEYFQVMNGTQITFTDKGIETVLNNLRPRPREAPKQKKPPKIYPQGETSLQMDTREDGSVSISLTSKPDNEEDEARERVERVINYGKFWESKVHWSRAALPNGINQMQHAWYRGPHDNAKQAFFKYKTIANQRLDTGCFGFLLFLLSYLFTKRDPITEQFYLAFARSNSFSQLVNNKQFIAIEKCCEPREPQKLSLR